MEDNKKEKLPVANRNVKNLINQTFGGNITQFARLIGVSHQRVDRLFKTDPRSGKYPSVSEKMKNAIKKTFNIDDFWFFVENAMCPGVMANNEEDIFEPQNTDVIQNDNESNKEKEIEHLKELLRAKDELIASKDNQIKLLEMIIGRENDKKV